jgi:hypothetical protein
LTHKTKKTEAYNAKIITASTPKMAPKSATSTKTNGKSPTSTTHTNAKTSTPTTPAKNNSLNFIKPSKGAVCKTSPKKGRSKNHIIKFYILNQNPNTHAVGVLIHGENGIEDGSWMAKLIDDMVRRPEYDLDPLPFFDGTFYLIGDNGEPLKNTNG